MPHIDLPADVPGIRSAMQFRPETAMHLNALAEELLRADSTLSRGDRELIAAYVSSRNKTVFCEHSHSAFAARPTRGRKRAGRGGQARPRQRGDRPQASRTPAHSGQGRGRRQERHELGHRSSAGRRRDRSRDPRHRPHRGSLLHVQPLRRRPRHLAARGPAAVSRAGTPARRTRLRRLGARIPLATGRSPLIPRSAYERQGRDTTLACARIRECRLHRAWLSRLGRSPALRPREGCL